MFTGIIQKIATVKSINSKHGDIQCVFSLDNDSLISINEGDSLSINGVCLTAYNIKNNLFSVDISNETLDVTTLTQLCTGYKVNLESSLCLKDKLGGHMVSGHVDCMAKVKEIYEDARSYRIRFQLNDSFFFKIYC